MMEIGILFAVLLLDNDIENTSIVQINLLGRCDRLMLTVLLSNFKAVSFFFNFCKYLKLLLCLKTKVIRKISFISFTHMFILCR